MGLDDRDIARAHDSTAANLFPFYWSGSFIQMLNTLTHCPDQAGAAQVVGQTVVIVFCDTQLSRLTPAVSKHC